MTFTPEQRRAIRSDEGRRILRHVDLWPEHDPIGNANLSTVLEFVRWGLIGKRGLTPAGRRALQESGA